jgi:hypothetical protein
MVAKLTAKVIRTRAHMVCVLVLCNVLAMMVGGVAIAGVVNGRQDQKQGQ